MIAAPPAWVLALRMDSGSWRCLVGLWSFADFGCTGPTRVWPTREQLAERTGQTLAGVKKQLAKLAAEGLIESADRGWMLAWRGQAGPTRPLQSPGRPPQSPAPVVAAPAPTVPAPAPVVAAPAPPVTSNYLTEPCKTQHSLAGDAPAPDSPQARHLAIVEQQARLAVERAEARAELEDHPRRLVTREVVDVVRAAGPEWAQELQAPRWEQALGETILALALAPAQVGEVLAAWDRACKAAGGAVVVEAAAGGRGSQPSRKGLWWSRSRSWVAAQLRPAGAAREAGSSRTATPLGCAAVVEVPIFGGRSW